MYIRLLLCEHVSLYGSLHFSIQKFTVLFLIRRRFVFFYSLCVRLFLHLSVIVIIIIAFKGAVRDFLFTISSLRREQSPTRTLKWPRHNRVIVCWLVA